MGYGAVEIHENKILPENLQELHIAHMFKEASEGVDRPTQGNSDFVVIFFFHIWDKGSFKRGRRMSSFHMTY